MFGIRVLRESEYQTLMENYGNAMREWQRTLETCNEVNRLSREIIALNRGLISELYTQDSMDECKK